MACIVYRVTIETEDLDPQEEYAYLDIEDAFSAYKRAVDSVQEDYVIPVFASMTTQDFSDFVHCDLVKHMKKNKWKPRTGEAKEFGPKLIERLKEYF